MESALIDIAPYVTHFSEAIASITGVDIEVIDSQRIRVAGTGIYAASIGESIETVGEIYNYALTHHETLFVDDPKTNRLCLTCTRIDACEERLTLCTPIVSAGKTLGIIGLVCFTNADRQRLLANRDVYVYFFRQIADGIARVAESEAISQRLRKSMDMLLKVTNSDKTCVLVMDTDNRISFINDAARRELGISPGDHSQSVEIVNFGDRRDNTGEFEIRVSDYGAADRKERHIVLGRLLDLSPEDTLYARALVFDSKQRMVEMFSSSGSGSDGRALLGEIVGNSRVVTDLKEQILKIASTPSTVLITGESGTGKEMFARAIHAASPRREGPFIAINCGAIPDALLESELFGHVSGAFTGANPSGRMGKFELADGGVLFLDEISSMPLYLQVKLLRVLQERSFSRLGSNKTVSVDIRVIAATNEKLPDLIAQRMFREDLYYRLNVIPIEIPPLRDRKEDIPILAEHFLGQYCRLFAKPMMRLSEPLLARMRGYAWPGNVREFENCIEYMVNMRSGGTLDMSALPQKVLQPGREAETAESGADTAPSSPAPGDGNGVRPLAELELDAIRAAIGLFGESSDGKRRAAEALGISVATLYRKIKV